MSMEENPYRAPESYDRSVVGIRSGQRVDLRKVAGAQRVILVCILINILAIIGQFFLPPELRVVVPVILVVTGLVATVFVIILAIRVYSVALGIILGLLTFIPCVGLIVLLMVNQKATTILQSNGIKVGLVGADMSQF
jgi:hypothetical protein